MIENLTFEQLPYAITLLTKEVSELKELLLKKQQTATIVPVEELLTVEQAAEFLNLSVPTIYTKVSRGTLPVMKKSKRLYFSNLELMNYLKDGRKKTNEEIEQEADTYLSKK
jgi:excisionase family DNA binding protein